MFPGFPTLLGNLDLSRPNASSLFRPPTPDTPPHPPSPPTPPPLLRGFAPTHYCVNRFLYKPVPPPPLSPPPSPPPPLPPYPPGRTCRQKRTTATR